MDIEVNRMSPSTMELLDQLSVVCKRFNVDYSAASEKDRFFVEAVALHEYQLKKAHEQGLKRSEVPPFLGLKRTDRSNDMLSLKIRPLWPLLHPQKRTIDFGRWFFFVLLALCGMVWYTRLSSTTRNLWRKRCKVKEKR